LPALKFGRPRCAYRTAKKSRNRPPLSRKGPGGGRKRAKPGRDRCGHYDSEARGLDRIIQNQPGPGTFPAPIDRLLPYAGILAGGAATTPTVTLPGEIGVGWANRPGLGTCR